VALIAVAYGLVPAVAPGYALDAIILPFLALSLAAVGLNLVTGYCGQLSLGSAAFMAVGAYAAYNFNLRVPGLPLVGSIALAAATAAAIGLVFGLPSLRIRGFYLAVSTLAAQFFVQWTLAKFGWFSNDSASGVISAPPIAVAGVAFDSPVGRYLFAVTIVILLTALAWRLVSGPFGANMIAVRDNETAARVIGVPVLRTKLLAFAISSAIIGVAGVLWAFTYLRTVEPAGFDLDRSFQLLFIVIIGGLASIRGAFLGAAFIVALPLLLSNLAATLFGGAVDSGTLELLQRILLGVLIILFLVVEPEGLSAVIERLSGRLRRVIHGDHP
jgi:branched-chain amino acid transport system permease protein